MSPPKLIPSSVSCSKTFMNLGQAPQCGGCSQCIDRRFAAYASKADDIDDSGLGAMDCVNVALIPSNLDSVITSCERQQCTTAGRNEFCEIRQFSQTAGIGNVENTGALALPPETRTRLRHDRPRLYRAPIFDRSAASVRRRPSLGRMMCGTRAPRSLVATPAASKPRRITAGEPILDQDRFAGPKT